MGVCILNHEGERRRVIAGFSSFPGFFGDVYAQGRLRPSFCAFIINYRLEIRSSRLDFIGDGIAVAHVVGQGRLLAEGYCYICIRLQVTLFVFDLPDGINLGIKNNSAFSGMATT